MNPSFTMAGRALKILLVDDSEFILQRLEQLLKELPGVQEVRTATSAEQAAEMIVAYNPGLVILDINLPGKNGLQMLKEIRATPEIDPIVVILTNNTLSGYRAECMQHGADYFLDKAKDFGMLPAIIEKTATSSVQNPRRH
ncbi:MAG: response regulator [Chitinophagaceae bacterium]|jgi:two-component system chemotaxis response regulator CheY|nr:response regulator [Chitinophagaceae bacterium]